MRKIYTKNFIILLAFFMSFGGFVKAQDLIITGLADGDLSGGLPKALELYVVNDVADLSSYSVALYSNGNTTIQTQMDFGNISVSAGDFILVSTEVPGFNTWFGFDSDSVKDVANFNGDDGVAILNNGVVVDRFGVEGEDASGKSWEYTDGWAYRKNGTGPDATFVQDNWTIKFKALDTYSSNADATNPFPIKTYSPIADVDSDAPVWETDYPMAMDVVETGFTIAAKLDETSTVYYVILESSATSPIVDEVKAGTGNAGAAAVASGSFASGVAETTKIIDGLTKDVTYSVYLVAEDDEDTPNVQDAVTTFDVTPVTPPSVIYLADFASSLDPFTQYSVSGEKLWLATSGHAEMNGYQSTSAEIDWFISPKIVLTTITSPSVSFKAYQNYGINDATHFLKAYYSLDYDGNTDNIATSTWVEVPFSLPISNVWTDIGPLDISTLAGETFYFAFAYNYPDNYTKWGVDEATILGYGDLSADADLTDLTYNTTSVSSFSAGTLSYNVQLAVGQTSIPTIGYTKSDTDAEVVVDDVTNLFGTEAERTATITVTAVDGTEKVYTIIFTVDNTGLANNKLNFSIYPVPADNFIKVSGLKTGSKLEIINITGVQVRSMEVTDQIMDIEISNLDKGIYLLRSGDSTRRFVKK